MFCPKIFTAVINSYLPEPHASLLNGIIFGVPLKTDLVFYNQIKVVGLLHLVVLSGINITFLSSIIASLTSKFSKHISILITILTIILFVIFVGPQAPIIRAAIMGVLTLVATISKKRNFVYYSLFLSFLLICVFWPKWINTISLQLSYGATLGIIMFGKSQVKKKCLFPDISNNLRISIAAQIFTVPVILFYFKQVSLISPLANLIVSPLIPSLMVFGFLMSVLGKINYFLGLPFAHISFGLLSFIIFVIRHLSELPFIFFQF